MPGDRSPAPLVRVLLVDGADGMVGWDDLTEYRWWLSLTEDEKTAAAADPGVAEVLREEWIVGQLVEQRPWAGSEVRRAA